MKINKLVVMPILIIVMFFSGCIERKTVSSNTDLNSDYIVYNFGKFPQDLSMMDNEEIKNKDLLYILFEGLVKTDENNKIVPGLAESWNISKDEIEYTFKLRDNAKWSNGEDITADDFVTFFSSILSSKTENIYASDLFPIFGAEEYRAGKKSFNNVAIRAVNKKTLEIRLNAPCSLLLNILAEPQYTLRKYDEKLYKWKDNYKELVFSGPFQIENITDKEEIHLVKSTCYWDNEDVKSDKIVLTSVESSESALANFENGKIDIVTFPPINEVKRLKEDGKILELSCEVKNDVIFNLKSSDITTDINLRKAINLIISNKKEIDKYLNKETQNSNVKTENSQMKSGNSNSIVDSARKLLKESKYNKKYKLKLICQNTSEEIKKCEAISKALKDDLDINIDVKAYEKEQFKTAIDNGEYDMLKKEFPYNHGDEIAFLEKWTSYYSKENYGYKNSEYDTIVAKAKIENDGVKKSDLIKRAEEILLNDVPFSQISYKTITILRGKNIEGIYVTKEGNMRFDRMYKKVLY